MITNKFLLRESLSEVLVALFALVTDVHLSLDVFRKIISETRMFCGTIKIITAQLNIASHPIKFVKDI